MEFNEYGLKDTEKRIAIKYLRNDDSNLNPWEITNFISRISSYFYKIEVLHTIALALKQGVEPNNIFILDREYKLNGNYNGFSNINLLSSNLNKLYSIGKPVSLVPNRDIYKMRLLFEYLYKANQILYKSGRRRITSRDRWDAYMGLMVNELSETLAGIEDVAIDKVSDEKAQIALNELRRERNKIEKKYQEYLDDEKQFSSLEEKLNTGIEIVEENESVLVRRYYNIFFEYFIKLQRPVIGIFYPKEHHMQILCADYFDNTINYNTYIDLKSITHNSPITAWVEAGVSIVAMQKDEKRKQEIHELEKKKYELEIANLQKDLALKDQEMVKNNLEIIAKKIEIRKEINSMAEQQEIAGIKGLDNTYTNRRLQQAYGKVQNGYAEILRTNRFNEVENNIIDMRT